MNYWTQSRDNIFVAAHRGWSDKYAENTMEAFRAAANLGVDQIETDVRLTKDGELVLFHDETLERVTDGCGKVIDHTLSELEKLKVKGAGRIPTLIEFLELFSHHTSLTLDMELKEYPTEGREALAYCTCVFGVQEGSITIEDVRSLHRKTGVRIWAGAYAKDEPSVDLAVKMGAELITCNNPDEVLSILRKKKLHR